LSCSWSCPGWQRPVYQEPNPFGTIIP
jgi:hypothetical protein